MGQREPTSGPPNHKGPQTESTLFTPVDKKLLRLKENYTEIPDQKLRGATVRPINQVERLTKRA